MSAAFAWIGHALDTHGEVLADVRMRARRSQAALAEEAGYSAGTIAYYLRVLGDAGSASRRDGLVVDRVALGTGGVDELARRRGRAGEEAELLVQRWAGRGDAEGRMELVDGEGRCPSVRDIAAALGLNPSTVQRHLDTLFAPAAHPPRRPADRGGPRCRLVRGLPGRAARPLTDLETVLRRLRALPPSANAWDGPSPCSRPAGARRPARRREVIADSS